MTPARLAWRQVRRGALVWSAAMATMLVAGGSVYETAYPDAASRRALVASLGSSRGLAALYGPAERLDTVGGFLVWRYGSSLVVVAALWAALAITRTARGDEEAGRSDLLVASPAGPVRHLVRQVVAVGVGALLIGLGVVLAAAAVGVGAGPSVVFGLQVVAGGWAFAAIGAVTAQLAATRRRAMGMAGGVLAAGYLIRALGDATPRTRWLGWASPLSWIGRWNPFGTAPAGHRVVAVGAVVALVVGAGAAAVVLCERRDTGSGAWAAGRAGAPPRRIRSWWRLELVLHRGALVGWSVGAATAGLLLGFIAADIVRFIRSSRQVSDMIEAMAGTVRTDTAAFVGLSFQLVAVVAALYGGAQVLAGRHEEEAGRLDAVLTASGRRAPWWWTRLAVVVGGLVVIAVVAAVAMWVGVVASAGSVNAWDCLRGGLNTVPVAVLFVGLAAACFGWFPRAVAGVAYGSVGVGYGIIMVTSMSRTGSSWARLSPFHHVAPVPAAPFGLVAAAVMVGLGSAGMVLGAVGFDRRDLVEA